MKPHLPRSRRLAPQAAVAITLLLALVLLGTQVLFIARLDLDGLFGFSLLDDSFYYFQIARQAIAGRGLTFDGQTPTNGFHPLWMLVVLLGFLLGEAGDGLLAVKLVLIAGALAGAATTLLVHRLAARATGRPWAGCAAAALVAANPALYLAWINGLETGLALLLFVTFLLVVTRRRSTTGAAAGRRGASFGLGLLAGLVVLARTDFALLVLPGLWAASAGDGAGGRAARRRRFVLSLCGAALAVLPWLMRSWAATGRWLQTSGLAIPYVAALQRMSEEGTDSPLLLAYRLSRLGRTLAALPAASGFGFSLVLLAGSALLLWWLGQRGRPSLASAGWGPLPALLLSGLGLTLVFHAALRLHLRPWYYAPFALAGGLLAAGILARLASRGPGRRGRLLATGLLLLALLLGYGQQWQRLIERGSRSKESEFLTLRRQFTRLCGPGDIVGATDAGYLGFTLPCRVINLDGVVNGEALAAMEEGRLAAYILDQGMNYVFLRGLYVTPRLLGEDFERYLEIADRPPRPILFRVLRDPGLIRERYRLAGRGRVDLTLLENRYLLRHFGGDPAQLHHRSALFGIGERAELTLWLPPGPLGYQVTVELCLGPQLPVDFREVEVAWDRRRLGAITLVHAFRKHRFIIPGKGLPEGLSTLSFSLSLPAGAQKAAGTAFLYTLAFRSLVVETLPGGEEAAVARQAGPGE